MMVPCSPTCRNFRFTDRCITQYHAIRQFRLGGAATSHLKISVHATGSCAGLPELGQGQDHNRYRCEAGSSRRYRDEARAYNKLVRKSGAIEFD